MNTAMHELDGRLVMRRIAQESTARQVLSHRLSLSASMLVVMIFILILWIVGALLDTRPVALGALMRPPWVGIDLSGALAKNSPRSAVTASSQLPAVAISAQQKRIKYTDCFYPSQGGRRRAARLLRPQSSNCRYRCFAEILRGTVFHPVVRDRGCRRSLRLERVDRKSG